MSALWDSRTDKVSAAVLPLLSGVPPRFRGELPSCTGGVPDALGTYVVSDDLLSSYPSPSAGWFTG